jgi:hypothetical protein
MQCKRNPSNKNVFTEHSPQQERREQGRMKTGSSSSLLQRSYALVRWHLILTVGAVKMEDTSSINIRINIAPQNIGTIKTMKRLI